MTLLIFFVLAFLGAGALGWRLHRLRLWKWVDAVYYPLAAFGVLLLFETNSVQRRLLDLDEMVERQRAEYQAITFEKPDVRVEGSAEFIDSSFRLVATISDLAAACQGIPTMDPRCIVAKSLGPSVERFLAVANARYASTELKLAAACAAGERFLGELHANEAVFSSLIAVELVEQYRHAVAANHSGLSYDAFSREVDDFERRAMGRIGWLRETVWKDDSESLRFALGLRNAEVEFGKFILMGLYPCIVAPRKDLDRLAQWTATRQSREEAVKQVERERDRVREARPDNPGSLWIHLSLWPFVITTALALKFAKGIASTRDSGASAESAKAQEPAGPEHGRAQTAVVEENTGGDDQSAIS